MAHEPPACNPPWRLAPPQILMLVNSRSSCIHLRVPAPLCIQHPAGLAKPESQGEVGELKSVPHFLPKLRIATLIAVTSDRSIVA